MKTVTVKIFGGTTAKKILVEELDSVLLVTTQEEWEASQREARAPITVGFRKEYMVSA